MCKIRKSAARRRGEANAEEDEQLQMNSSPVVQIFMKVSPQLGGEKTPNREKKTTTQRPLSHNQQHDTSDEAAGAGRPKHFQFILNLCKMGF